LLALAVAGCTELVVVGKECVHNAPCVLELDGNVSPAMMDAGQTMDASAPELDAAPERDASADAAEADSYVPAPDDAAVWMLPELDNLSFELSDGQPGDVTAVSLPTGTSVAPWFSCQVIGAGPGALTGVRAETAVTLPNALPELVLPEDGRIFIAMQYFAILFPPALQQMPKQPLRAGTHYGFAIDVRSSNPRANLALQVYGSREICSSLQDSKLLAATDPITDSNWHTVCLRFTTTEDLAYFKLVENAASAVSGDRLFFDNMRSVEDCPP
jgi:hypothetical protein